MNNFWVFEWFVDEQKYNYNILELERESVRKWKFGDKEAERQE
jgi:hypothetical protein